MKSLIATILYTVNAKWMEVLTEFIQEKRQYQVITQVKQVVPSKKLPIDIGRGNSNKRQLRRTTRTVREE